MNYKIDKNVTRYIIPILTTTEYKTLHDIVEFIKEDIKEINWSSSLTFKCIAGLWDPTDESTWNRSLLGDAFEIHIIVDNN